VRHVKSNAIVLAQSQTGQEADWLTLVGMGAGQPSRVAAVTTSSNTVSHAPMAPMRAKARLQFRPLPGSTS